MACKFGLTSWGGKWGNLFRQAGSGLPFPKSNNYRAVTWLRGGRIPRRHLARNSLRIPFSLPNAAAVLVTRA
jgi:hypothetical protein